MNTKRTWRARTIDRTPTTDRIIAAIAADLDAITDPLDRGREWAAIADAAEQHHRDVIAAAAADGVTWLTIAHAFGLHYPSAAQARYGRRARGAARLAAIEDAAQ